MPLKNKYLKYTPEITLEIFTLVWDKLKSMFPDSRIYNWKSSTFDSFRTYRFISIWGINESSYAFGINNNPGNGNLQETTVQEILGYDPFIKDEFVLPEKWCIKYSKEVGQWFDNFYYPDGDKVYINSNYKYLHYPKDESAMYDSILNGYTEITFDQFKKYVLEKPIEKDWVKVNNKELLEEAKCKYPIGTKFYSAYKRVICEVDKFYIYQSRECGKTVQNINGGWVYCDKNGWAEIISLPETKVESKQVVPEYAECVKGYTGVWFKIGNVYKVENNTIKTLMDENQLPPFKDKDYFISNYNTKEFKPSTKEAYDAQNQLKSIGKWSVGSYVVFLKDNLQNNYHKKGEICRIRTSNFYKIIYENYYENNIKGENSVVNHLEWFTTLQEAEEFAKTLVEPVKEKVKFITGKWYQYNSGVYLKFERIVTEKFRCSERIVDGIYSKINSLYNTQSIMSASIEEIQQYLPDEHPDKISKLPIVTSILNNIRLKLNPNIELKYPSAHIFIAENPCAEIICSQFQTTKVRETNLLLSIDDEDLPMTSIIKTKIVNLLNND